MKKLARVAPVIFFCLVSLGIMLFIFSVAPTRADDCSDPSEFVENGTFNTDLDGWDGYGAEWLTTCETPGCVEIVQNQEYIYQYVTVDHTCIYNLDWGHFANSWYNYKIYDQNNYQIINDGLINNSHLDK